MKLRTLAEGHSGARVHGGADPEITGISYDSRTVERGHLFAALRGEKVDGLEFVPGARRRGAAAVLSERTPSVDIPWIEVSDARAALADLAAAFYGRPAEKLSLAGVTGTNGKTTTAFLIEAGLRDAGRVTGLLGTVETRVAGRPRPASLTTPECSDLQRLFAEMVSEGVTDAALEVSSHALSQGRVRGVDFKAAVFTNLTRDHLDYHKTFEAYFEAKSRLFTQHLRTDGRAIVNIDDEWGRRLASLLGSERCLTFSQAPGADFHPEDLSLSLAGTRFTAVTPAGRARVDSPLVGHFNVSNLLGALGALVAMGLSPAQAARGVSSLAGVPGRMERVEAGQAFTVLVDYAHTDDALRNLLDTVRSLKPRRVITVFGCGGDRDRSKRPLMGAVAAQRSDLVIATSDNPRSEPPEAILDEIALGLRDRETPFELVVDRRLAIEKALRAAEPGDVVAIAGKGHEATQTIRDRRLPFDDRQVARQILGSLDRSGGAHAHP